MAVYPTSLKIGEASSKRFITDRDLERATNGALRGRLLYTNPKSIFQIEHVALNASEILIFEAFYNANLNVSFSLDWAGTTYTVLFGEKEPTYKPAGGGCMSISFEAEEV